MEAVRTVRGLGLGEVSDTRSALLVQHWMQRSRGAVLRD
jgi:hypothetical protein